MNNEELDKSIKERSIRSFQIKLHNRRVRVTKLGNGDVMIQFITLDKGREDSYIEGRAIVEDCKRGRCAVTTKLSDEAASALKGLLEFIEDEEELV